MSQTLIVIHNLKDWAVLPQRAGYQPSSDYCMNGKQVPQAPRTRIINLCRNFDYGQRAIHCSLLSEARGHNVIPSVRTLNDLSQARAVSYTYR